MTLREHLNAVAERSGELPARLRDAPRCPDALAYLWALFIRLRRRCTPSMGTARILYSDMAAFVRVTGERLSAWEVSVIERVDDAFAEASRGN